MAVLNDPDLLAVRSQAICLHLFTTSAVMNSAQTPLPTGSGKVALCRLAQPFFECAQAPPLPREPAGNWQGNLPAGRRGGRQGCFRVLDPYLARVILDTLVDLINKLFNRHRLVTRRSFTSFPGNVPASSTKRRLGERG